jgi:hypothetical protein
MIGPMRWDVAQNFLGQITMRINQPHAMPQGNVLGDQVQQQGGFAGACLSDDVDVLALIHSGNAKGLGIAPAIALADCDGLVIHGAKTSHHSRHDESPACSRLPLRLRRQNAVGGKPAR